MEWYKFHSVCPLYKLSPNKIGALKHPMEMEKTIKYEKSLA
jgi:hypothetical protein